MATLYLQAGDDLVGAFKQVVANPNTKIIAANGKPITLQRLGSLAFNPNQTQEGIANSVAQQALVAQEVVANQAAANVAGTKPSTDTLANLGGTGTVADASKINTQGNVGGVTLTNVDGNVNNDLVDKPVDTSITYPVTGLANSGTQGSLSPYDTMDATGATPEKVVTPPSGLGYLTKSDFDTANSTLKSDILTGVDAKNKAFGTQATQGFMDAFKNFQIPTNQQTGVNLGNYNDNRNAAADQWWSQYVTGRR